MGKGLPRSMSRGSANRQEIVKQTIPVRDLAITVTAAGVAAVGFGSAVLTDIPDGNILLLGASANLAFAGPGSANLTDTWSGDYSVGTTPTADATLGGSDADIIPATAIGPAAGEAIARTRGVNATQVMLDNVNGALELNLNLLVDEPDIVDGATVTITANGEVNLLYSVL